MMFQLILAAALFGLKELPFQYLLKYMERDNDPFKAINAVIPLPFVPEFIKTVINKNHIFMTINITCECGFVEQYTFILGSPTSFKCKKCDHVYKVG